MGSPRINHWTLGPFPPLDVKWFRARGVSDPKWVHRKWEEFRRQHPTDEACFRKALALAVGVNLSAVAHYLTGWMDLNTNRTDKLSRKTRRDLDEAAASVVQFPPHPVLDPVQPQEGGHLRVLLITGLQDSPSPRFHLTMIRSLAAALAEVNISLEVQDMSQSVDDMAAVIGRLVRISLPRAIVFLRLTPTAECLRAIYSYSNSLPVVLVHADRLEYEPPVLANVVPDQRPIFTAISSWTSLVRASHPWTNQVVIAAMAPDRFEAGLAPRGSASAVNIRDERIQLAVNGVRASGGQPVVNHVPDYRGSHASTILSAYPDAAGYVCLSDELAVSIWHLLQARGVMAPHVIGFDGSDVAERCKIPSFDQRFDEVSRHVTQTLLEWFRREPKVIAATQPCQEVFIEIQPPF